MKSIIFAAFLGLATVAVAADDVTLGTLIVYSDQVKIEHRVTGLTAAQCLALKDSVAVIDSIAPAEIANAARGVMTQCFDRDGNPIAKAA